MPEGARDLPSRAVKGPKEKENKKTKGGDPSGSIAVLPTDEIVIAGFFHCQSQWKWQKK